MPSATKFEMSSSVAGTGRFVAVGCAPCRVELCSIPLAPQSEISGLQHFVSALFRGGVALESLQPFPASGEGYQCAIGRHKVVAIVVIGLHALPVVALLKTDPLHPTAGVHPMSFFSTPHKYLQKIM